MILRSYAVYCKGKSLFSFVLAVCLLFVFLRDYLFKD